MNYPAEWCEFEDSEGTFLFYNPESWNGNFRISAFRGPSDYGKKSVRGELAENDSARVVRVGQYDAAYSCEMFEENGQYYTTHLWVVDGGDVAFDCSFTVPRGASPASGEAVVSSLQVRRPGVKYPAEVIPVRLSEVYQINEAYEWTSRFVKDKLKKELTGTEEDIELMQQLVAEGLLAHAKREAWMSLGIVLCVILANETGEWEWRTLIDGNREAPLLLNETTGRTVDPMKLAWSKVRAGEPVDFVQQYVALANAE